MSTLGHSDLFRPMFDATTRDAVRAEARALAQLNNPEVNKILLEIATDWDRFMDMYEAAAALAEFASEEFLTIPVIKLLTEMVVDHKSTSRLRSEHQARLSSPHLVQ